MKFPGRRNSNNGGTRFGNITRFVSVVAGGGLLMLILREIRETRLLLEQFLSSQEHNTQRLEGSCDRIVAAISQLEEKVVSEPRDNLGRKSNAADSSNSKATSTSRKTRTAGASGGTKRQPSRARKQTAESNTTASEQPQSGGAAGVGE